MIGCKMENPIKIKFEKNLPVQDLMVLDEMTNEFGQLIKNKYKGKIENFLADIVNKKTIFDANDERKYCLLLSKFRKSTLEYKSEKLKYDTVYASNNYQIGEEEFYSEEPVIMTVTQNQDTSWEDLIVFGEQTTQKKIQEVKNRGYWNHISESSFVKAIIESKIDDKDIQGFIDSKQAIGDLNPIGMANSILESKIDVNDYLIKRIIIFEIFRKQIKKEHGC